MSTLSPLGVRRPPRAPDKSATFFALQRKGLELPSPRKDSISPQSTSVFGDKLQLSPLSALSAASDLDPPLGFSSNIGEDDDRRPSVMSFETELSNILDLYMNSSSQSLKSEYEEDDLAVETDNEDVEEERISVPTFHQPKAYRDTIAPLLEHQFSTLTVPTVPSPISVASIPMLVHPNAIQSVPSLDLTPDLSLNLDPVYGLIAAISSSSIQITPEMSPALPAHSFEHDLNVDINLEVPDVREADGWYDHPLSPVSPEEINSILRDSQSSAVSPHGNEDYQRQLTFEALAPPQPQSSLKSRLVDYVEDVSLSGPNKAFVSEIIDNQMLTPPLELNRSPCDFTDISSSVQQQTMQLTVGETMAPRSRQTRLVVEYPIEGPIGTYLTTPPPGRLTSASPSSGIARTSDAEETCTSISAFSDSTVDSLLAPLKLGRRFRKALKLGKKKKLNAFRKERTKAKPIPPVSDQFTDDIESYKYRYWKSRALAPTKANNALPPSHRLQSPSVESAHRASIQKEQTKRSSAGTESVTRVDSRPASKPEDWPTTRSMDQNWYKANKEKQTHNSIRSQDGVRSAGYPPRMQQDLLQLNVFADDPADVAVSDPDPFPNHNRSASRAGHVHIVSGSTNTSRQSTETGSIPRSDSAGLNSARRSAGTPASYNNDLFEVSGGKKRSNFGSRLFMAAEEKRKLKVKESIVVVGGAKMDGRTGRDSGKTFVNM